MIDGLHLPHFNKPDTHGLRGSLQHTLAVVLSLVQNLKQESGTKSRNTNQTFCSGCFCISKRKSCGASSENKQLGFSLVVLYNAPVHYMKAWI